ncbi:MULTISPECIES: hypothetical protein [unclassified Ruegeria]|uniref:hypothetical protein n=1 Tax=unclassified Ruegeria TaxID=2625375 RepID=UPI00148988B2|nr:MULTISPECIES: hypothetical protein [unclassified Ruegeria]NOD34972.1 hypothetical protein [Ruegeria sp. HKCCD7296]NOD47948.1 hypothetical protein [Ruegeria sp. HKCCD5849]NOD52932.1 hypothetical protein [Ruegeria sp. HKCCD5851]NOD69078.1 hypothetical protein [Ruegeria sp. HKCCD7303]NOE35216.1 hypothetical protein [Ruegeria sp. HKCCD7318]
MEKTLLKMTMGLGIMVLAAQQVQAQGQNCAPREDVLKRLHEIYGEERRGFGLARQGAVMELFASGESGSWTITVTLPNGITCLVASGQAYEEVADALPPNA